MTEYALTDADGTVRWRGTIDPPPGGGSQPFTGWTGDEADPANVDSNGGGLTVGGPLTLTGTLDISGSGGITAGETEITQEGDEGKTQKLSIVQGVAQDDGNGLTSSLVPASLSLEGSGTYAVLGPENGSVFKVKPGAGDVGLEVVSTNTPGGCIKPNGVALLVAAARPEIPATPTEQDIADVLVALGLATQAAP